MDLEEQTKNLETTGIQAGCHNVDSATDKQFAFESDQEDDDTDEEEDEPRLKYARMTTQLGPVYRNGDATSAFVVAGDKMVGHARM